jgi:hypothetical protein
MQNSAAGEDTQEATNNLLASVKDSGVAIRSKQLQNFKQDRAANYKDQDSTNPPWIGQAEERAENGKRCKMFNARRDQQSWPLPKRRQGSVSDKTQGSPSGNLNEEFLGHQALPSWIEIIEAHLATWRVSAI